MKIVKVFEVLIIMIALVNAYFMVYFTQHELFKSAFCCLVLMGIGIFLACCLESVLREEYNTTLFGHKEEE